MKKVIMFLLALTLLSACSSEDTNQKESNKDSGKKEESVEVDKKLFNVEITLPASMFEDKNLETIQADAKENGIKEVTKNEDGSITYKMSKSVHKELMKDIATSIEESVEEMKTSEDYVSIKDITHNDSFSIFTVVVDQAAYENSMDGFATLTLGMSGMMYQLYDGVSEDDYSVKIKMEDKTSGKTFDEVVYPDALEETEEG
ncbi:membrane lipoprotein lipid attachment site-containing protein [Bacillus sp. es.034]|uniref:membrane lipoprotein lipid attachment site-containing protein n=1 Tax=Bacillus sp. es.034 TaxID=1761763 RepID=UPI000BF70BF2|nr:membrane lipoprotein lipid attachment site-containing protein [Bacillus sp. es.034]PFG03344.1 hypothetical protein ATG71_0007 [Bacillus sp. es.034]PFG07801.1 hypothetical protein ATG71_4710 [Bacillus sp. es.034]